MGNVIYVADWRDSRVVDIAGDCMLAVAAGVHFHVRTQQLVVVTGEIPPDVARWLPKR